MSNLVIYGPPGTGKTRRCLKLIYDYIKSGQLGKILFCSHTRAAAHEAMSRWPKDLKHRVDIQTLHSVCFRALKLSRAQTVDFNKLKAFGEEFGIDMGEEGLGRDFLEVLSLSRSKGISAVDAYMQSWRPGTESYFDAFAKSYQAWKDSFGYVDFDDMLALGKQRLTVDQVRYPLIVIDEAQDLTPLHWRVVYRMIALLPKSRVIIAGDDDQALYAFAGADPAGMPQFAEHTGAESQVLSQSFRITQQVYNVAQAIIANVKNRVPKAYVPRTGFDGKPAQGLYQVWPHMDYLQLSRDRDSLLLYADRFVRAEVEPILQENGHVYKALNGFPSPIDSRAGKALRTIMTHSDDEIINGDADELRSTVRNGLSAQGQQAWDSINRREILARIRRDDWSNLYQLRPQHADYFRNVDWKAPQNVRISTMHGAKGLQGDDVHLILSLSQAAWAQAATDPDSLHRLFYTAVTRTRENLYIYDGEQGYELPGEYR